MREERFVKKQEERMEGAPRRGAGEGDEARRDQRTVAHQPEGAPLAPCAVEAEGGDGEREEARELRAGEDVSDVSHVRVLVRREDRPAAKEPRRVPARSGHVGDPAAVPVQEQDRKSTRLNSSHSQISYAVFCLKKKKKE